MFGLLAIAVAFVVLRAEMSTWPDGRRSHEMYLIVGTLAALVGGFAFALCAVQLAYPARLVLSPSGLISQSPWSREEWAWNELGEFNLIDIRGVRFIAFSGPTNRSRWRVSLEEGRVTLPGNWESDIADVCRELNAARDRWGGGVS